MPRAFNSAYLESGMRANPFLPRGFGDPAARFESVQRAASRRVAPELLVVLREQNSALPPSEQRRAHLEQLERGAALVVTGQQVGLFLGPLYTVYKAASAVALARALSRETGLPCVPLFWLQTEDHDFEEVRRCQVPLDGAPALHLELEDETSLARRSLADRTLPPGVAALIDSLARALEGLPRSAEVIELLSRNYRPGIAPGIAFAGVLGALFAEDGLLVLDPRCAPVSRLAAPLVRRALRDSNAIDSLLAARGEALRAAGYSEQIQTRPGSPLPFFHLGEARGPRQRLSRRGELFEVQGTGELFDERALSRLLDEQPLRFSTSALLRPLLQDAILPTAVYVGGPAEVNYSAQVSCLYPLFELTQPLLAERAHLALVPPPARRLLDKLGLAAAALESPRAALLEKLTRPQAAAGASPAPDESWAAELEARLQFLIDTSGEEPAVKKAAQRLRASVRGALSRLAARHVRARLARDAVLSERLARLGILAASRRRAAGAGPLLCVLRRARRVGRAPARHPRGDRSLPTRAARARPMSNLLKLGISCYPTYGGSGIIATELGHALARRGHQVHFICSDAPRRFAPEAPNVFLHEVKPPAYPLFQGDNQYALALASKMVEATRAAGLELLHVHYAIPHAAAAVLARQILGARAPKLVTTLHGTDITVVGGDPSFLPVTRYCIEESDGVTTPSRYLREATWQQLGVARSKEIEVISNFVDTDAYAPRAASSGGSGGSIPVLVHNSNFRALKRVDDVLRIFAIVRRQRPCALAMIGDGPERASAERLAAELGVSRDVRFLGERLDFLDVLQGARVFLLPSASESFGLAALEAQSCGVPVIASRIGGLPEVVSDGETGFLAPVGAVEEMAAAALRLLDDNRLHAALSRAARAQALERFRLEPMVDRYLAYYRRVLER